MKQTWQYGRIEFNWSRRNMDSKFGEFWDINSEFIRPTTEIIKCGKDQRLHTGWFVQKLTIYTKKRK